MTKSYFLDTYALIEIIKGNRNYKKFLSEEFITLLFNLYELYYILLRDKGEDVAEHYFLQFRPIVAPVEDKFVFTASRFRLRNVKNKFSYIDALGYATALDKGFQFLTGDKEFKGKENVEFVK